MPPHHRHPPGPPPHHRHHRISSNGIARASDILARCFDSQTATALVEQAICAPQEPTSLFFGETNHCDMLAKLLDSRGVSDLKTFGEGIIDPRSHMHSLHITDEAVASLQANFPKDVNILAEGLMEGPDEMCAVAVVQALNARLGTALADIIGQPQAAE